MTDIFIALMIFIVSAAVFWLGYREFGAAWDDPTHDGKPLFQRLVAVLWD